MNDWEGLFEEGARQSRLRASGRKFSIARTRCTGALFPGKVEDLPVPTLIL